MSKLALSDLFWVPMLWVCDHYKYAYSDSAAKYFRQKGENIVPALWQHIDNLEGLET